MNQRLKDLMAWVDARQVRERALLLGACVLVLSGGWNLVLLEPLRAKEHEVDADVQALEQRLQALQAQADGILRAHSTDPNVELRKRADSLRRQIEVLDARIAEHTVTLIKPREVARFLEELLSEHQELRLVRLENVLPEPILDGSQTPEDGGAPSSGLYKHGFEIELRGGYLGTLRYLQALESLPWNFFWETLDYETQEYPEGKTTIRAFTIGTEEVWVGA